MSSEDGRVLTFCEVLKGEQKREMRLFTEAISAGERDKASRILASIGELSEIADITCLTPEQRRDRK